MRTGYGSAEAVLATGVNRKTLHHWSKTGLLQPCIREASGTGSRRLYSFNDLVILRCLHQLRGVGVRIAALRKAARLLQSCRRDFLGEECLYLVLVDQRVQLALKDEVPSFVVGNPICVVVCVSIFASVVRESIS